MLGLQLASHIFGTHWSLFPCHLLSLCSALQTGVLLGAGSALGHLDHMVEYCCWAPAAKNDQLFETVPLKRIMSIVRCFPLDLAKPGC